MKEKKGAYKSEPDKGKMPKKNSPQKEMKRENKTVKAPK